MRLLIDTHVVVWSVLQSHLLSQRARDAIEMADEVFVSAASAYEIAYKRDRDRILSALPENLDELVKTFNFRWLSINAAHAQIAGRLPDVHRDPFDRLIAAQSISESLSLVTRDRAHAELGASTVW
ncbi:MAG: PilT protein domain protein [Caulobacteraceae bacterium]|nr:PilT protein domain protein [Caulobacteraceae bacterium]